MPDFQLKTVIPTFYSSNNLICNEGAYFASNTNLFHLNKNNFKLISSCDGDIKHFTVKGEFSLLCTEDRIYFNHRNHFIGALKRCATAIDCCDEFFVIGSGNFLEVWLIPKEYKFSLFTLKLKCPASGGNFTHIKIIDSTHILTASEDCTVRIFDISTKESRVIARTSKTPAGLHFYNGKVAVTAKNGSITWVDPITLEYKNEKINGFLKSSASYEDLLACAIEDILIDTKDTEDITDLLPSKILTKKPKEFSKKTLLIIYKNGEEIFKAEIDYKVEALAFEKNVLFIKTENFVGSFDIVLGDFTYSLDLPKIVGISTYKNMLGTACKDNYIRIYQENSLVSKLIDKEAKGELMKCHVSANICTAIYKNGYVSCFNINDSHCFRSFLTSDGVPSDTVTGSHISDDGCFLFLAHQSNVKVIDLIKGKLIETINLKSPIINLIFYKNFLYTLELDKTLTKNNVFSGFTESIELEDLPTNFSIQDDMVCVSTIKEIIMYSLDLNYINSFLVSLEGRNRSEIYSKPKQVDRVIMGNNCVFCAGQSNFLKVFGVQSFRKEKTPVLIKNILLQIIQISRNKDKENYKAKLFREKEGDFNKDNVIEVADLCFESGKLYVLANECVQIYEKDTSKFVPIEFDVIATEEFIYENLHNPSKAIIAAIKLNDPKLIKLIIDSCTDVNLMVKFLPNHYAKIFLEYSFEYLKQDFTNIKLYEIIKTIFFYHRIEIPGMLESINNGALPIYSMVKKNKHLIESIKKKK